MWHYLSEPARPQPQQELAGGPAGTPGETLGGASLNEAKIAEDVRGTSVAQLVLSVSLAKPPSLSVDSKHLMCYMVLASAY